MTVATVFAAVAFWKRLNYGLKIRVTHLHASKTDQILDSPLNLLQTMPGPALCTNTSNPSPLSLLLQLHLLPSVNPEAISRLCSDRFTPPKLELRCWECLNFSQGVEEITRTMSS